MTLTIGIDEAGRGPALGPLVMAAVALDATTARALRRHGLRDSKQFGAGDKAQTQRQALAEQIVAQAPWHCIIVVDVPTIDARVARGELNALERETAAAMLAEAPGAKRIIADGARMFAPMRTHFPNLLARDKAEALHASVAAASVLAKARRDAEMHAISVRYSDDFGPLRGGGYVNDGTRAFLIAYTKRYGRLPPEARRSWPHPYVADYLAPTGQLSLAL